MAILLERVAYREAVYFRIRTVNPLYGMLGIEEARLEIEISQAAAVGVGKVE